MSKTQAPTIPIAACLAELDTRWDSPEAGNHPAEASNHPAEAGSPEGGNRPAEGGNPGGGPQAGIQSAAPGSLQASECMHTDQEGK